MQTSLTVSLLKLHGVGPDTAATLLVTAGDNPKPLRSEPAWAHICGVVPIPASSGKTIRHRIHRGGDRNANSVPYQIVITRMASCAIWRETVGISANC